MGFIIFFSIFLAIYGSVNYYIFIRGWQALPNITFLKTAYLMIFIIIAASFILGQVIERFKICLVSNIFVWIGSLWLGFMAYFFLSILIIDIFRVLNHFLHFFPPILYKDYEKTKLITGTIVVLLSTITVIIGIINARIPAINRLELDIPKRAGALESLRIAMASDIHLGTIVSNSRIETLVNRINELNPDIVLLPGDIVDGDVGPVIEKDLGAIMKRIESKYGVYAVTGNHEFIGGVEKTVKYLEDHDIIVLRDRAVKIDNGFYLIGRDDLSINRYNGAGRQRKSLEELINGIDCNLPVILMDHQPFHLHTVAKECVDLQISGHTHNGQLWPFNLITSMIYELDCGYAKIGNTHFYVSPGYGTWGPPVRTNARPEIVEIILNFKK